MKIGGAVSYEIPDRLQRGGAFVDAVEVVQHANDLFAAFFDGGQQRIDKTEGHAIRKGVDIFEYLMIGGQGVFLTWLAALPIAWLGSWSVVQRVREISPKAARGGVRLAEGKPGGRILEMMGPKRDEARFAISGGRYHEGKAMRDA